MVVDFMTAVYLYILKYDSGFAPNPFYGYCTLATCKPKIRSKAKIGDWVLGFGSKKNISQYQKLVYAMEITASLSYEEYWSDKNFQNKKPNLNGSYKQARGDNIYYRAKSEWQQLNSYHSNEDGTPNRKHIKRDTSATRVLISDNYVYYGKNSLCVDEIGVANFKKHIPKRQGHIKLISKKDSEVINLLIRWFNSLDSKGYKGDPLDWDEPLQLQFFNN